MPNLGLMKIRLVSASHFMRLYEFACLPAGREFGGLNRLNRVKNLELVTLNPEQVADIS
jgi:hypothetical protein